MSDPTAHYNVRQSASYARTLGITQRATPLAIPWAGELRVRSVWFVWTASVKVLR